MLKIIIIILIHIRVNYNSYYFITFTPKLNIFHWCIELPQNKNLSLYIAQSTYLMSMVCYTVTNLTLLSALTPEQAEISTRSPCSSRVCARVNLPCTAVICKGDRPSLHWNNIHRKRSR